MPVFARSGPALPFADQALEHHPRSLPHFRVLREIAIEHHLHRRSAQAAEKQGQVIRCGLVVDSFDHLLETLGRVFQDNPEPLPGFGLLAEDLQENFDFRLYRLSEFLVRSHLDLILLGHLFQVEFQGLTRPIEPAHDRADRHLQKCCHLLVREPLPVVEPERQPVGVREPGQTAEHFPVEGPGPGLGHGRQIQSATLFPPFFSVPHAAKVERQGPEPGNELFRMAEFVKLEVRLHKGIVSQVFRIHAIAGHPVAEAVDQAPVARY